jgi:hypothetical protein
MAGITNLGKFLAAEHSKPQCDRIVRWVGANPKRFGLLMDLFFNGEYRITQRAAWPMSYCAQKHPELVGPYFPALLAELTKKGKHDAVKRNIVRLFQAVEIPKKYHGKTMSICFGFIESNEIAVAIKAFSLSILGNLSANYPDILPELKVIIDQRWPYETAAFRSRAKKILEMARKTKGTVI